MEAEETAPFGIDATVRALCCAVRGDVEREVECEQIKHSERSNRDREKLWFKESSVKNLRNRDFLLPSTVLASLYPDSQVGLYTYVVDC